MFTNNLHLTYDLALHNYDIFPKVVPAGKTSAITVKALGGHAAFKAGEEYQLQICPFDEGDVFNYPGRNNGFEYDVTPDEDGCIRFSFEFFGEQQYFIRIKNDDGFKIQLVMYSLLEDLVGRYPFRGDLHMHSCKSDGRQAPAIVCAEYRKTGYDFMALTDHRAYEPSLETIAAYKDVPIEMTLVPGEEVHLPKDNATQRINDIHIINFGADKSINTLGREDGHHDMIDAYAETIDMPEGLTRSERYAYADCHWIFSEIRKAGGLGIFCHPYWISNVLQIPPSFVDAFMEKQPFDAFEVLGGENNFEQNGFQTLQYYEDLAKGRRYAIVGSTDTHSAVNNRNSHVCSTLVFSPENERGALIASIKDLYSVAVDTIDETPRFVGSLRLARYACFLDKNFFPLHDELCFEEGRAMKAYACGEPGAKETLEFISGRMKAQREKYFAF